MKQETASKSESKASAVIELSGKQYVVKPGQKITVEKIADDSKKTLTLKDLLTGKNVTVKIGETVKGKKIVIWRFKNKTRSLRRKGHRQTYSIVTVESIA